jgi:hypothetical protein
MLGECSESEKMTEITFEVDQEVISKLSSSLVDLEAETSSDRLGYVLDTVKYLAQVQTEVDLYRQILGNIEISQRISVDDLKRFYDTVKLLQKTVILFALDFNTSVPMLPVEMAKQEKEKKGFLGRLFG